MVCAAARPRRGMFAGMTAMKRYAAALLAAVAGACGGSDDRPPPNVDASTMPLVDAADIIGDAASSPTDAAATDAGCAEVTYTPGADGQRATLCMPAAPAGRLAVVLVHGGGSVQGTRAEMRAWQEFFVANGAVTLNIDYALVDASTPKPVFPLQERQVKAAVRYLRERAATLKVDRIVLLGTSAGARLGGIVFTTGNDPYFVDATASRAPDRLDGFVGLYGGYNGGLATGTTGLTLTDYYGGEPTSTDAAVRERYAKANATANAANASGPALLFHGDADMTAPPMQSMRFDAALKAAGKDSTLVIVPGAEHSFDREKAAGRPFTPEGQAAATQTLQWLRSKFP